MIARFSMGVERTLHQALNAVPILRDGSENLRREFDIDPYGDEVWAASRMLKSTRDEALSEFAKLAQKGSPLAMAYLAESLLFGLPPYRVDESEGIAWALRSRSLGSIEAGLVLSRYFLRNERFEPAAKLLSELSSEGFSAATCKLALLHHNKLLAGSTAASSIELFALAERQGHLHARRWLGTIYLSDEEHFRPIIGFWKLARFHSHVACGALGDLPIGHGRYLGRLSGVSRRGWRTAWTNVRTPMVPQN